MLNERNNLNTIQGVVTPLDDTKRRARVLVRNWERTGLLEGLEGYDKSNMAILLENQARQLLKEATQTGTTENSEEWSGVALPLVRKIYSEIPSKNFVSVQPMNMPNGLVFYMNFKYGTTKTPFTSGQDIFGTTHGAGSPSGGLYGSGRYGYSIANYTASVNIYSSASVAYGDIEYNSAFSASYAGGAAGQQLRQVLFATSSLTELDTTATRAFTFTKSGVTVQILQQFTKIVGPYLRFIVSGSQSDYKTGAACTIYYQRQPSFYDRGDFEQNSNLRNMANTSGGNIVIPEVNLEFQSEQIVAKTRKLKAVWTPEIAQDLNAYHSVDAEAELTAILSEQIAVEMDLEILDMLMQGADTVDYWSARMGYEYNGNGAFIQNSTWLTSDKTQWFKTLGIKLAKVSNQIHQKTLRGQANFCVVGPEIATIFDSMPGFNADTAGGEMQFAFGAEKIGSINSRLTVYKNPYMAENTILLGYRGNAFLETGAVFAPYIPLVMSPLVLDPDTFTPRKAVQTRYAKKLIRGEFFAKIHVHGLNYL